ncbi:MAG TPA: polysaccharide biosynthesis/export family protein [Vicinamibacterales bacterium]|jgi:polysaccharide export outer membrane protein
MIGRLPVLLLSGVCVASIAHAQEAQPLTPSQAEVTATTAAAAPAAAATSAVEAATAPAAAPAAPAPRVAPVVRSSNAVDMSKEYLIGPEDVLDITVWKNCPDLCRTVPVRPDGKMSLPLVNDVQAAGLTPMDLRRHLTEQLAEYLPSPEVSVIVREVHNFKVAVVGSVKMPGDYEIKSQATVLELIARAQGLTEFANRDKVVVLRQNGTKTERIKFNYRKVAEGNDEDNFFVRAGDIIVVP